MDVLSAIFLEIPDVTSQIKLLKFNYNLLSPRETWEQFNDPLDLKNSESLLSSTHQERFLFGRSMLKQCLASFFNLNPKSLEICSDDFGRPTCSALPANHSFNMTHSYDFLVIAIGQNIQHLGVDLEKIAPRSLEQELLEHIFSDVEFEFASSLEDSSKLNYFYKIWSLKEALTKAEGRGHFHRFSEISILDISNGLHNYNWKPEGSMEKKWNLYSNSEVISHYSLGLAWSASN